MATKVGKIVKITCGTNAAEGTYVVAEMGTYTLSGFSREALDSTAFGDDVKEFVFGVGDAGEITFSGFYDPSNSPGQVYLNSHCSNGSTMISGQIRFYVDSTSYLTVGGGTILITKSEAIAFDKAGIGTVEFSARVSGSKLVLL